MARFLTPVQSGSRGLDHPFLDLHREMNRLLDDFAGGAGAGGSASAGGLLAAPRMDVRENEREVSICCELPGVKPADIDLRVEGDLLTIRGEKKHERDEGREDFHVLERSFGRFQRSVQLPFVPEADKVKADFRDGVLTVRVPKRPEQERSQRIRIESAGANEAQPQVEAKGQGATDAEPKRPEKKEGSSTHH